jgi:hypothetical protein
MDPKRTIEILRALADGRDPATGAPFPPDSPYQQADTVRALHAALDALTTTSTTTARSTSSSRKPDPARPKAGVGWTPAEEDNLRAAFAANSRIPEIAAAHGRTKGAITARLIRLGLLDPATTHSPVPPHVRPSPAASVPAPSPTPPSPAVNKSNPPPVRQPNPPAINRQFSNTVVLSPEDEKNLPF